MNHSRLLSPLFFITLCGCGSGMLGSSAKDPMSLEGTGGKVAIGDSMDRAKTAFPPAKGAQTFDKSMNFAILKTDGWAWVIEESMYGFEAASKDGKIVGLALTHMKDAEKDADKKEIAAYGEPTKKAIGQTASVYVWSKGDNARMFINMTGSGLIGSGNVTIIGKKSDLKLLNFDAEDPGTFVKQMDSLKDLGTQPPKAK